MIVYTIIDTRSSPDHPLGDAVETFIRAEDAERFVGEVRGDDPELASHLRIEERELDAGGLNQILVRLSAGSRTIARLRSSSASGEPGS